MKIRLGILCIFILYILTFISFSNFESEAKTIDVTIIDASSDFVRVMLDIYGYTPNDKRVSVRIESTGGQFIQQTDLNVREKNDFMWGAQMSFIRTSSSVSSYNVFVYNEDGAVRPAVFPAMLLPRSASSVFAAGKIFRHVFAGRLRGVAVAGRRPCRSKPAADQIGG